MKYVKWIFVVLLISSLTSFVEKDKPGKGLSVGDIAPDFTVESMSNGQQQVLSTVKGSYVLLSFWASFDAPSRLRNVSLSNELKRHPQNSVKMVSVSLDTYNSIFEETVRKDRVDAPICVVDTRGEHSAVYKKYRLNRGFNNYLLNEKGVIIAKNLSPDELSDYLYPAR